MGFLKIIGALLLALSGALGAYVTNQRAAHSLRQAEGWLMLLRLIRTQVECFSLPISRILSGCDPSLLIRCGYGYREPPDGLESLWRCCEIRDGETDGLISDFVREFGKGYREEQLRSCDYYVGLLSARRDALASQLPARKRVSSTLWISGALATVILLI